MLKLIITLCLFFCIVFQIISQEIDKDQIQQTLKDKRKFKNEFSLDMKHIGLNSLFNGSTLLYKRSFRTGKLIDLNSIRAMRIGIKANIQDNLNERHPSLEIINNSSNDVRLIAQNKYNLELLFGLEKQNSLNHIIAYYGMDMVLGYNFVDDDVSNYTLGNIDFDYLESTDFEFQIIRLGINPFFGLKYYFTKFLGISMETGFYTGFFKSKVKHLINDNLEIKSNGYQFQFNNIRFINLSYHF